MCIEPRGSIPGALAPERTPGLILGPFYPLTPAIRGAELYSDRGGAIPALEIGGRVVDRAGRAVAAAVVEIWHADEFGRYAHPSAPPRPADRGEAFVGHGVTRTDEHGRYHFRTRKPGAYREHTQLRAPHVHFQVTGQHDRLVTQMFFADDPRNAHDRWYRAVRDPQRLVARTAAVTSRGLAVSWDIVLTSG
ncbi:MAG: hypothetical protein LKCHEGNO_00354 [Burkholderiaceae bacterium]|nr:hypothetical protein [Burkholderiaceae bacterium]